MTVLPVPVQEALPGEGCESPKRVDRLTSLILDDDVESSGSTLLIDSCVEEGQAFSGSLVVLDERRKVAWLWLYQDAVSTELADVFVEAVMGHPVEGSDLHEEEWLGGNTASQVVREHVVEVRLERVITPGRKRGGALNVEPEPGERGLHSLPHSTTIA